MVPVRQMLVSSSKYQYKCPNIITPTRIVVHNTANNASANNEVSYMIGNADYVSYHYAVDDKEIVQGIPENRNTWNTGDGSGKGNMEGISIEICYSLSGGSRFTEAEKNAAWFVATLLTKYNWDISKVTKHQDYNGKYCPHRTLDMGWQRFLLMVQTELANLKGDLTVSQYEELKALIEQNYKWINDTLADMRGEYRKTQNELTLYKQEQAKKASLPCPDWAKESVQKCINLGIVKGNGTVKATVDNVRPMDSITRAEMCVMIDRALEE